MGYFKPSHYTIENALREVAKYDGIYVGDNYVTKDHGSYIEINIETDNGKGHVSYDLYFDESERLIDWRKHLWFKNVWTRKRRINKRMPETSSGYSSWVMVWYKRYI